MQDRCTEIINIKKQFIIVLHSVEYFLLFVGTGKGSINGGHQLFPVGPEIVRQLSVMPVRRIGLMNLLSPSHETT